MNPCNKVNTKKAKKPPSKSLPKGHSRAVQLSVLDNRETFLYFSSSDRGSYNQKKSYLRTYQRHRNLSLANRFIQAGYRNIPDIDTLIGRLLNCSKNVIVEKNKDGNGSIFQTSKFCRSNHCAICNAQKSAKLSNRLVSALCAQENQDLFQNKHFYFLTLTIRHTKEIRNYNYLKEFREYQKKLFDSKLVEDHFLMKRKGKNSGMLSHIECTMTNNGYHIHSHCIIIGNRLEVQANKFQKQLQQKWKKITGDSDQVRFDLIKKPPPPTTTEEEVNQFDFLLSAVKEIFKYSTKTGAIVKMNSTDLDLYKNWIVETKGKNFINASGILRGLKLTGSKSPYDMPAPPRETEENANYYLTRTANIKFNHEVKKDLSTKKRREILSEVFIQALDDYRTEVTKLDEMFDVFLEHTIPDQTDSFEYKCYRKTIKYLVAKSERIIADRDLEIKVSSEQVEKMINQMKLFENEKSGWKSKLW